MSELRAACKRKTTQEPNVRASKIVYFEAKRFSQVDYNDVKSMAQTVYNEKLKDRPSLPKSTADVLAALRDFKQTAESL